MGKRRLGRTDIEITPIGLGCWQFAQGKGLAGRFWSVIDQAAATATVKAALDGGISWFDTAEMYGGGRSETVLTTALHDLEIALGRVVIATKWVALLRWAGNIARTIGDRLGTSGAIPSTSTRFTCLGGFHHSDPDEGDGQAASRRQDPVRWRKQLLRPPDGGGGCSARKPWLSPCVQPGTHQPAGPQD